MYFFTVETGNVAEQLHKNEKSSHNENGDQSIEQQNKSLCTSVNEDNQRSEEEKEEEEKTEKKNHEGTGRLHKSLQKKISGPVFTKHLKAKRSS